MRQRFSAPVATIYDTENQTLYSDIDLSILEKYPELERLILFLNQLKSMPPYKRGAFCYRVMDVLELTRKRFLRRIHEANHGD